MAHVPPGRLRLRRQWRYSLGGIRGTCYRPTLRPHTVSTKAAPGARACVGVVRRDAPLLASIGSLSGEQFLFSVSFDGEGTDVTYSPTANLKTQEDIAT